MGPPFENYSDDDDRTLWITGTETLRWNVRHMHTYGFLDLSPLRAIVLKILEPVRTALGPVCQTKLLVPDF